MSLKDRLSNAKFDVEHTINMYAEGFCTLPAEGIYDKNGIAPIQATIDKCHTYDRLCTDHNL
jgi:hypothetical protein